MSWPLAISPSATPPSSFSLYTADEPPVKADKSADEEKKHPSEAKPAGKKTSSPDPALAAALVFPKLVDRESDPKKVFYSEVDGSLLLDEPFHLRKELGRSYKREELMAMVAFIAENEELKSYFWSTWADFETGKYNSDYHAVHRGAFNQMLEVSFNDKQIVQNFMEAAAKAPRKGGSVFKQFLDEMNKKYKADWKDTLIKFRFTCSLFAVLLAKAGKFYSDISIINVKKIERSKALPNFTSFLEKYSVA